MKNSVELKTKKMNLANIENRLSPVEMENIMAGSGGRKCVIMGMLTFASMFFGGPVFLGSAIYTVAECA